jgi:ribosomal protein S18 acetylase RimI-like enzyme
MMSMQNPSIKEKDFAIRPMRTADIASAIKLSKAEGWNQTEKDWKLFIENPGNVCLLAEFDNNVIGTTTAINYSNKIAWIAMVLVDKEYRGRGVSKSLLTNILQQLQSCTSVKLDATAAGQEVYKKFDFCDEYEIARLTKVAVKDVTSDSQNDELPNRVLLTDIPEIISFDENVFGANRCALMEYMVREYPGKAWLLKRNERVTGIALGRDGNKYHHIGPVLASNAADAKILITKALKELSNQPVVVDVLSDKVDLLEWLLSIGFVKQRQFIRMYKKHNPFAGHIDKQFLICGPEFG